MHHNKREVVTDLFEAVISNTSSSRPRARARDSTDQELAQIEAEFRKGLLDVFVIEDLGRLVRGVEAVRLLGIAVDNGVRVNVPNDNIDTANASWEADAIKACADHVAHNAHTSRRLKHKLKNRFMKNGGAMARPIAGYVVPEDAETNNDWLKDPLSDPKTNSNANPWIYDGEKMLRETLNCSAVGDMFNASGIATGPYCTRATWNGAMVRRFYGNPLLKGMPSRNTMHSVKFHEIGRRTSVKKF